MGDKEKAEGKTGDTDKDLSELLDSALADFGEKPEADRAEEDKTEVDQEWTTDYIRQAAEQFETNIASLLRTDEGSSLSTDQIQASFQKMAEAAQQALQNPGINDPVSNDFASTISQTIQGLTEGAENLQNPFSENDIMSMFSNMQGGESGGGEQNAFLPFMQGMMQSLLSKDVLYPGLKDILEKYPGWLQENESKLSPEEKDRYVKQKDLMEKVCEELEQESENDSADVRRARFDKVLELMQKLQDYGQPPTEIVGDVGPTMPFDQQGNPEQCSVM